MSCCAVAFLCSRLLAASVDQATGAALAGGATLAFGGFGSPLAVAATRLLMRQEVAPLLRRRDSATSVTRMRAVPKELIWAIRIPQLEMVLRTPPWVRPPAPGAPSGPAWRAG